MSDKPKSTIADLEKMLDCADDRKSIEIRPNGEVVQLSTIESLEKNLRMAREENELLHTEIKRLRAQIGKAIDDLKASVHERQPLPLATLGAEGDGWGMSRKRIALIAIGIFVAPFVFYGWMALIGKFLNIVVSWSNR